MRRSVWLSSALFSCGLLCGVASWVLGPTQVLRLPGLVTLFLGCILWAIGIAGAFAASSRLRLSLEHLSRPLVSVLGVSIYAAGLFSTASLGSVSNGRLFDAAWEDSSYVDISSGRLVHRFQRLWFIEWEEAQETWISVASSGPVGEPDLIFGHRFARLTGLHGCSPSDWPWEIQRVREDHLTDAALAVAADRILALWADDYSEGKDYLAAILWESETHGSPERPLQVDELPEIPSNR